MALENPDSIEFEMEADVYTLRRTKEGVQLIISDQVAHPNVSGAKVMEDGSLEIMGRGLGKLDQEASGDAAALSEKLKGWYPPGQVKHAHSMTEFDSWNTSGITVGKFSAKWCGPCKAVAPAIEKLSLEYPDVTFIHADEDEAKNLFMREKIQSYPTFLFWKDGEKVGQKVQGADAAGVEAKIQSLGAQKVELQTSEEDIVEEDMKLTCERDVFCIEKTSSGISLMVNGKMAAKPGECPHVEINRTTNKVSFGRGGGVLFSGGNIDVNAVADAIQAMFPTQVTHIHSVQEFDGIIADGIVCAKFSADWCGPCKAIAGFYHDLSNKFDGQVKFLHIDVDDQKVLSQREKVSAMPTFHFYVDGAKQQGAMVRGANKEGLKKSLRSLGVAI